jgi:hypothetical protein
MIYENRRPLANQEKCETQAENVSRMNRETPDCANHKPNEIHAKGVRHINNENQ